MPEQLGLRRLVETEVKSGKSETQGRHAVANRIIESLRKERKERKPGVPLKAHEAFSIRELHDAFDGRDLTRPLSHNPQFMEAAIVSNTFPILTSNIFLNAAINAYEAEEGKIDLVSTPMPSTLKEEVFPGVGAIDEPQPVKEGEQYPEIQIDEKASKSFDPAKEGFRAKLTREMALFDQTGLVMRQMQALGKALRVSRERRGWKVFTDHAGAKRFFPKTPGGFAQTDLYRGSASVDPGLWYKMNATQIVQPLNDWESICAARQAGFGSRTDEKGRLAAIPRLRTIVVPLRMEWVAMEAIGALQVRRDLTQSSAPAGTSAAVNVQIANSPLSKVFGSVPDVIVAPMLDTFAAGSTGTNIGNASNLLSWYMGNPQASFFEQIHWGVETSPLPGDPTRDVIAEYLGSRKSDFVWQTDADILRCLNVATA